MKANDGLSGRQCTRKLGVVRQHVPRCGGMKQYSVLKTFKQFGISGSAIVMFEEERWNMSLERYSRARSWRLYIP